MAENDIKQRIIFDDSSAIQSLTNQYKLVTKVNEALKESESTFKDVYDVATKQIDATNEVLAEGTQVIGKHTSETIKAKNESKGWGSAMKGLADEVNVLGVNLGGTIDKLRAKATALKGVTGGLNGATTGAKVLGAAMKAIPIFLLISAFTSLVAFFKKTEAGAEKLERVMAGVGAVVNVLTDRVAKLGGAVVKFFSGDFAGAAKDAKDAVSGINEELTKEVGIMVELKRREQELDDQRRANNRTVAENIVKLKEAQLIADDATKSTKERIANAKLAGQIEKDNLAANVKAAEEDLAIAEEVYKVSAKTDADEEARDAKFIALQDLKADSLTRQKKLQSQLQGIQAEAAAKENERLEKIREINKALEDQVKKIQDAAQKAKLETLDPTARILAEAEIANAIVEEQFKLLDQLAKNAGKEVDLSEEKSAILLQIEKDKIAAIQKLREDDLKHIDKIDSLGQIKSKERMEATLAEMQKIQPKATEIILSPIEALNKKLGEVFGLKGDEFAEVMASMGNSLNSLFDSMTAGTDRQLEENEALIDSIHERRDILNEDLEKELERQEQGLAYNIAGKKKELEALQQEEQKAEKEREKLRKKQLAAKIAADSISQGSSLITMGANVIAAESGKGLLGVGFALAAIAAFFTIYSGAKAQSKKLYRGGSLQQDGVSGFVNSRNGRTDRNGGRGHKVEDSNLVLGGEEYVMDGYHSMKYEEFLKAMSRGEFDSGDGLHFAMGHTKELAHGSAIASAMSEKRNYHGVGAAMSSMIKLSLDSSMGKLIAVIKDKPDTVAYTPGQLLRSEKGGKVTIKQTEPDWKWKPEARG